MQCGEVQYSAVQCSAAQYLLSLAAETIELVISIRGTVQSLPALFLVYSINVITNINVVAMAEVKTHTLVSGEPELNEE